jgi:hypothetical protein
MIYKRGKTYWYKFMWQGKLVRESTKQSNDKVARQMESAHRTSLAKGEVGIREKKAVPSLRSFCDDRFEPWAKATFEENAWKNWEWYRVGVRALLSCKRIATPSASGSTLPGASRYPPAPSPRMRAVHASRQGTRFPLPE